LIEGLYIKEIENPAIDKETTAEKKKLITTFLLATTAFFVGYSPSEFLQSFVAVGDDKQIDSKLYSDLVCVRFSLFYLRFQFIGTLEVIFGPCNCAFVSLRFNPII